MNNPHKGEHVMKYSGLKSGEDTNEKKIRFFPVSPYKFTLFVLDLFISFVAFLLGVGITIGSDALSGASGRHFMALFVFSSICMCFFSTYNLYSYHLIFSKRNHFINLFKSFFWSLLTFCMIAFLYVWPYLFGNNALIIGIFLFASSVGLMLLARFFWDQILNILKAMGVSCLVIGIIGLVTGNEESLIWLNWITIALSFLITMGMILTCRFFGVHLVFNKWLRRHFRRQIVIVGSDQEAQNIANHIIARNAPFWVSGSVGIGEDAGLNVAVPKDCLGTIKELPEIVAENSINEIIVTDENIGKRTLIYLLDYCTSEGITVWFPPKLLKIIDKKFYIDNFCGISMIRLCSQRNSWIFNKLKYGIDALVTLPVLFLMTPVFLVIAIAIKFDSKGPVFYRAEAIGKNGRPFKMFKFRSMRTDGNSDIHKKYVTQLIKGEIGEPGKDDQVLKIMDDPRITAVGRILRKLSLDELPQLINVVKGDMSLVGPRPCLPYEYEIYKDWHKKRTCIRPGISGLWQVAGRSSVAFEDMILLDLYYIYNRSFLMDMNVLYETIFVVLKKQGAH